jgi:hypothetical protein
MNPSLDILEGVLYRDGDFLELRVRFADTPLTDQSMLVISGMGWDIEVTRYGDGMSLVVPESVALDPCVHLAVDDSARWLVARIPLMLLPNESSKVSLRTGSASGTGPVGDSVVTFDVAVGMPREPSLMRPIKTFVHR